MGYEKRNKIRKGAKSESRILFVRFRISHFLALVSFFVPASYISC